MKKTKKNILLILFSLCVFLCFAINFSSSNLSSSVLGDNDDIQIQINQKNMNVLLLSQNRMSKKLFYHNSEAI